jgi:hypothetical protein
MLCKNNKNVTLQDHHFTRVLRICRWSLLCALSLLLVFACSFPGGPQRSGLTIVIAASAARTIVPSLDMTPAAYVVAGSGPGGAAFSTTITSGTSANISLLAAGAWTVTVDGKNAAGTFIVHGSAPAQVVTGTASTVSVTVLPIAGPGSLNLAVSWPAASVAAPSITAQLVPSTGSPTNLTFSAPSNGSSSYSGGGILNGYYTLIIQLYDGATLVAGAVDVAQIVQDQTTSGTYAFTSVNSKGSIAVNITPNLLNPIAVTLGGAQATVGTGAAVTLSAAVPAGTGNVTCAWYLNGAATAIGASYTLNGATSALTPGTYRVDVTAFTSDGLRAGSASTVITVTP